MKFIRFDLYFIYITILIHQFIYVNFQYFDPLNVSNISICILRGLNKSILLECYSFSSLLLTFMSCKEMYLTYITFHSVSLKLRFLEHFKSPFHCGFISQQLAWIKETLGRERSAVTQPANLCTTMTQFKESLAIHVKLSPSPLSEPEAQTVPARMNATDETRIKFFWSGITRWWKIIPKKYFASKFSKI